MILVDVSNLKSQTFNLSDKVEADNNFIFFNIRDKFNLYINVISKLNVSILLNDQDTDLNIQSVQNNGSNLVIYMADFSKGNVNVISNVNIKGNDASYEWHLASLAGSCNKKKFDISADQCGINTTAVLDNYGVCKDESKLEFSGICHIYNGSSQAKAHQNAKIVVFDEKCDAIAKPILKIDENDVEASHAAIVGKVNEEQIFYLLTRGISELEAKKLIIYGYLKPICKGFNNELSDKIMKLIEEEI